uniref:Guanylate cyclase domain-containing protein n=3 Tax=Hemiselmis andersenii TaxID=464988 RepID=A0A7S0TPJ4_HEMAN|mmetsp:Transcript_21676/g.49740  ORF Transcript_21676/g.49740 Transcript_21676/m.49740 type:complete len:569 (+) Transcript_21676:1-1707(+)
MVVCCGGTLHELSAQLALQPLGQNGVAFIVQIGGAKGEEGLLVAAAGFNQPLVTAIPDGSGGFGSIPAVDIGTVGGKTQAEYLVSGLSLWLLEQHGSWGEVPGQVDRIVDGTELPYADASNASFFSLVDVRAKVFDGTIQGWETVGPECSWSDDGFRFKGMRWLAVTAVLRNDFYYSEVERQLSEANERLAVFLLIRSAVTLALMVATVIVTCMNTRRVANPIKFLKKQMDQIHRLKFDGQPRADSYISEIRNIQETFIHMRHCLQSFGKFVPKYLIERLTSPDESVRLAARRLGMRTEVCTVLHISLQGFDGMSEALNPTELVHVLEMYLTCCTKVVEELGGTLGDFGGDRLVVFWTAERSQDHSLLAAGAVLQMAQAVEGLPNTPEWTDRGLAAMELRCRFGMHRGESLVGNFGTPRRLKYGVFGDVVQKADAMRSLNQMFGESTVLVSDRVREALHGSYICKIVGQTVLPGDENPSNLYSLQPRSKVSVPIVAMAAPKVVDRSGKGERNRGSGRLSSKLAAKLLAREASNRDSKSPRSTVESEAGRNSDGHLESDKKIGWSKYFL